MSMLARYALLQHQLGGIWDWDAWAESVQPRTTAHLAAGGATATTATTATLEQTFEYRAPRVAEPENDAVVASWGRPGGDTVYVVLEDLSLSVDEGVRAAAQAGRAFASRHLGIRPPGMRFYLPENDTDRAYVAKYGVRDWPSFAAPDQDGHADRSTHTIGVRADIEPQLAAEVAAHECLHLAQPGDDSDAEEADALAYGRWAAGLLIGSDGVIAGRVHLHEGPLWREYTLQGVAEHGDVMVAVSDDGTRTALRNSGFGERVEWFEHYVACPLERGG